MYSFESVTDLCFLNKVEGYNNNNNNNTISPHNIQEIKIYNNSTGDDRGAGCPK